MLIISIIEQFIIQDESDYTGEIWTERDNTIHTILLSANPKYVKSKVYPDNTSVWRIREVSKTGCPASNDQAKLYENVVITVFKGVKIKRNTTVKPYFDLIQYGNDKSECVDEERQCLFESEQEAKVHLRMLLQNLELDLRKSVVTEEVWIDLQKAETTKSEVPVFEQNREAQIQNNNDSEEVMRIFGESCFVIPKKELCVVKKGKRQRATGDSTERRGSKRLQAKTEIITNKIENEEINR